MTEGERPAELVALLDERASVHQGRSEAAVSVLRAQLLAGLAPHALPPSALPIVLEELTTAHDPWTTAAAARALQGEPLTPATVDALCGAFRNMVTRDRSVRLDPTAPEDFTTPLTEILETLALSGATGDPVVVERLAPYRDGGGLSAAVRQRLDALIECAVGTAVYRHTSCCGGSVGGPVTPPPQAVRPSLGSVLLEDHDGEELRLSDFLGRAPTGVTFFYTRCGNPQKCSLTVTRVGQLQDELARRGRDDVQLLLVTYDPGYDTPPRLQRYALDRGFVPTARHRVVRAVNGHHALLDAFEVHAGYSGALVNRHALELHLVAIDGTVARTWSRVPWTPAEVADGLAALVEGG